MRFEQLKKNFLDMEFDEQLGFITSYTEKRLQELNQISLSLDTTKAKKSPAKSKDKQIKLNPDQLRLLKQLGLV